VVTCPVGKQGISWLPSASTKNGMVFEARFATRDRYAARAGIEGTHAQAVSRCGLRRCRYIGLAKTRLQHALTAAAVNLVRVAEWCAGTPVAKIRRSRFAAL
jgi:transposase